MSNLDFIAALVVGEDINRKDLTKEQKETFWKEVLTNNVPKLEELRRQYDAARTKEEIDQSNASIEMLKKEILAKVLPADSRNKVH